MPRRISEISKKISQKVRSGVRRFSQAEPSPDEDPKSPFSLKDRKGTAHQSESTYGTPEFFKKYGKTQEDGAQMRRWMDDANEPNCHIQPCSLTFGTFLEMYPDAHPVPRVPDAEFKDQICALGLPNEWDNLRDPISGSIYRQWAFEEGSQGLVWRGSTGPGFILISEVHREDKTAPPISHISQAFYERNFPLTGRRGLKTIFVSTVIEDETDRFIRNVLYTVEAGIDWAHPGPPVEPQTWTYGTREFDGLMGTRIGKTVAYIILGAFPRGTRRIRRIVTWPAESGSHANMQFDIEEIGSSC